jgi:hypothetical protein
LGGITNLRFKNKASGAALQENHFKKYSADDIKDNFPQTLVRRGTGSSKTKTPDQLKRGLAALPVRLHER